MSTPLSPTHIPWELRYIEAMSRISQDAGDATIHIAYDKYTPIWRVMFFPRCDVYDGSGVTLREALRRAWDTFADAYPELAFAAETPAEGVTR